MRRHTHWEAWNDKLEYLWIGSILLAVFAGMFAIILTCIQHPTAWILAGIFWLITFGATYCALKWKGIL